jgi:hypothetical protein
VLFRADCVTPIVFVFEDSLITVKMPDFFVWLGVSCLVCWLAFGANWDAKKCRIVLIFFRITHPCRSRYVSIPAFLLGRSQVQISSGKLIVLKFFVHFLGPSRQMPV